MASGDGFDRALEWAQRAMQRMKEFGIPPNPENYTLWYVYFSGDMPELNRSIDRLVRQDESLTSERCGDLYRQFFSSDTEVTAVRETGERTQAAITKVMELLETAGVDTTRYSGALDNFKTGLERSSTPDQLRAVINLIAAETKVIAAEHTRLQGHLTETSKQLATMRANLQSVRKEALTDSLTGITNRKGFDLALQEATAEAQTLGRPVCLLMVDIDFFKRFNDTHGHLVGDHVLKLVARGLTESIKGRDTAARYGGEEFAIILPQTTLSNAVNLGNQIRQAVASRHIVNRNRTESYGNITLSVGGAQYIAGEPVRDLIARADRALYQAKNSGRNRVCCEPPLILPER